MSTAELRTQRRRIQSMSEEKNDQSVSEEESEHLRVCKCEREARKRDKS